MKKYEPQQIEPKWQKYWAENGSFEIREDKSKKKFYGLIEFPYPSGDGLHTGHLRSNTALDIICRKRRMQGYNVLYPIGFDSFGLPAENYAIKKKIKPQVTTANNIKIFSKQLKEAGFSFDWSRSFSTTDEDYYKWTEWIFLQMFKKGLAEKKKETINWCTICKIGLANEEVVNGVCERCGGEVVKKEKEQWVLKITKYADRLIDDLDKVDYLERIKTQQINWIGRSEGALVKFPVLKFPAMLFASGNPSKKARIEKLLKAARIPCKVNSPQDLGLELLNIEESGGLRDNAIKKALAYKGKTNLPVMADDTGFFVDDQTIDPTQVKRNALAGQDEQALSREEISQRILGYYKKLAAKHGGNVEAYWLDSKALVLPSGEVLTAESKREVILTDKIVGEIDPYFPMRSLYRVKATGKYIAEQTAADELKELYPITKSLIDLLTDSLTVFTTRPDTLFGATFMVVAPEHELIQKAKGKIQNYNEAEEYIEQSRKKSDLERTDLNKEKTGVELKGIKAINPANGKEIPIFVADYVMMGYGTGAIMAVPAHDERDWEFARKYNLPVIEVVKEAQKHRNTENTRLPAPDAARPPRYAKHCGQAGYGGQAKTQKAQECFTGEGIAVNSGEFNDLPTNEFKEKITKWLEEKGLSKKAVNYKLHDWIFSRQRYWGEPIPLVFCENCAGKIKNQSRDCGTKIKNNEELNQGEVLNPGWYADESLPVILPDIDDFMPTENGDSPLAKIESWVKTKCPVCGGEARRETDVMPNWAGSNWYFIRYTDPKNNKQMVDPEKAKYWLPVDWYNGGMEHTTLHLLYSRFVWKFLYDIGAVPQECGVEPYGKRTAHGMILGSGGVKMSKSKGNIINPDEYIRKFGADTLRVYEMFLGPFDQAIAWEDKSVNGVYRFLNRVWNLQSKFKIQNSKFKSKELDILLNKTIKKVGEDIEVMKFNTAVAQLMILVNEMEKQDQLHITHYTLLITLLSPFAPHICEELWQRLGHNKSLAFEKWPEYDPVLIQTDEFELVVQINGKVRDKIMMPADITENEASKTALASDKVQKWLNGQKPKKVIYIKGKLLSIVS